jgi:hypothetical protein
MSDFRDDWPDWPEDMACGDPPVCVPCAHTAVKACPSLRTDWVAVRAQSRVTGVSGALYRTGRPLPIFVSQETVPYYATAARRWVVASRLVRTLHDCQIVTL